VKDKAVGIDGIILKQIF